MEITPEVAEKLGYYVYVYIDPRNDKPFYIGKGTGWRVLAHWEGFGDSKMAKTIQAIRQAGKEPRIDILRYGLTEPQSLLVEAGAIDLIGLANLTNKVSGHRKGFGRVNLKELIETFGAKPAHDVKDDLILIKISRLYRSDITPEELYEATRGMWVIGPRRERVEYGIALYLGVAKEVYKIKRWHPAGTLKYVTGIHSFDTPDDSETPPSQPKRRKRWEFEGEIAPEEVRQLYKGKKFNDKGQNPIRYLSPSR